MKTKICNTSLYRFTSALLSGLVLLTLLSACSSQPTQPAPTETPQPTSTVTFTPEPTATNTSTATATATVTSTPSATPDRTGTAVMMATTSAEDWMRLIQPDLDTYQITLDEGHFAFMEKDPFTVTATNYDENVFYKIETGNISDFFMQTVVTWDSTSGLAGCGLIFRADSDISVGKSYSFMLMRLQYAPAWWITYYEGGRGQYRVTVDGRPQFSDVIDDSKFGKNRVALLARGDELTTFINGKKFQTVKNNKKLDGDMGYFISQESGQTSCSFANTVIWEFDKP
jgi:hypothetical protein